MTAFTFGENWLHYSRLLDEDRIRDAITSVQSLIGRSNLEGCTVLDVGCGSGLFTIACVRLGAIQVTALDRDPDSIAATQQNVERFAGDRGERVEIRTGDILKPDLRDRFDIVYAWGSLHHTGAMWRAVENAACLCRPGGTFVVALYNRTWLSPTWLRIKELYHRSPAPLRIAMAGALTAGRVVARALQLKQPFAITRGMHIWYDAVDWLGGLPYEYATPDEVCVFMDRLGSSLERAVLTRRLGCNEFVFRCR
jgi:SAM-dependent methyltransferase